MFKRDIEKYLVFFTEKSNQLKINAYICRMKRIVKIYSLSHPITNEIRYIGKTVEVLGERLRKHLQRKDETYRYYWIKSLLKDGLKPKIELIDECCEDDWRWCEKYWIEQFKCWGFRLVSMCDGGLGSDGMKHVKKLV